MSAVVLAMLILILAVFVGLAYAGTKLVKAMAKASTTRAAAEQYLAENDHESEMNKGILFASLIGISVSFYLLQIVPFVGWPLFLLSVFVFTKALSLCSLTEWARKEVHGEYETAA